MDFGTGGAGAGAGAGASAGAGAGAGAHTTTTSRVPPPQNVAPTAKPAERRAQKLKREYVQKKQVQNRMLG